MYDGTCISYKNKKSNIRCKHKCKVNSLFCGYHKNGKSKLYIDLLSYKFTDDNLKQLYMLKQQTYRRKIQYFINKNKCKYLDKKYGTYLITGDSSWNDILPKYRIYLNKTELWDIRFLVKHFATQLDMCNSSLPSPQLPNNPFNRKVYSYNNLIKIKKKIDLLPDIHVPIQLKLFLKDYDPSLLTNNNPNYNLINFFNKYMRFKIINKKDSQDNYIGKWVSKDTDLSIFENIYNEWNDLSPYIAMVGNIMIPNPEKEFFKEILNSCELE